MTRFQPSRRGDGLAARVALVLVCLIIASLAAGGRSAVVEPPSSAPSAESLQTSPAGAVDGFATTNSTHPRLIPVGLRAVAVGSVVMVLTGARPGPAGEADRSRGVDLVLDDVGDRWRALLIGAPPALFSV